MSIPDDPRNPYSAPRENSLAPREAAPSHDPSVAMEPHLRQDTFREDPSEFFAARDVGIRTEHDRVEHSVWDEPALSGELTAGALRDGATYAEWLAAGRARTTAGFSWAMTLLLAAIAGPLAVAGTFLMSSNAPLMLVVVGPLTEEIMKLAAALWVVELRPYWFRSPIQILCCMAMSGLVFAAIENVIYLNVYIPNPSPEIIAWRWTVCTALHAGCSLVAGMGLVAVWRQTMRTQTRPQLPLAAGWWMAAVMIHGAYNGMALLLEWSGALGR